MYFEQIFPTDADLPEEITSQVLAILHMAYPEGFQGKNKNRTWINNPADGSIHVAIATENHFLVSFCSVVRKELLHVEERYDCWGLTAVLTEPKFRNKGHGSRVVEIGTKLIVDASPDIGMFHCAKYLKGFYVKNGWIPMEQAVTLIGNPKKPERSDELMMMLFLSEKAKANRVNFEKVPVYFGEETW